MKNFNLKQQQILRYWHTLEYLAPFNLEQQIDQAEANRQTYFQFVSEINNSNLPWLDLQTKIKLELNQNKSYKYQIYYGVFDARLANNELLRLFNKKDIRDDRNDFLSCFGRFSLDNNGTPIPDSLSLSSLPWALGHLQSGEIGKIIKQSSWNESFKSYSSSVSCKLKEKATSFQVGDIQLDAANFKNLIFELTELCDWTPPESKALAYCFAVEEREVFNHKKEKITPQKITDSAAEAEEDATILNSFYVEDLQTVKDAFAHDNCGAAIKSYLLENEISDTDKFNLDERHILEKHLAPKYIPLGRWASDDENYQSLMQQAAINISLAETAHNDNLFSVNGPPGTGKTTMLRDIIAALLVNRAIQLTRFENPHDAFTLVSEIPAGKGDKIPLYKLDSQITGFEMVVASSNNSAVKNITQEIPSKNSIGRDYLDEAVYFQEVAENIFASNKSVEPWGMVAAVLGNSANKNEFRERFWFDKPTEDTPHSKSLQSDLFRSESRGIADWKKEKAEFLELHRQVSATIEQRQTYFDALSEKRRLKCERESVARKLQTSQTQLREAEKAAQLILEDAASLEIQREADRKNIQSIAHAKPPAILFWLAILIKQSKVEIYNQKMDDAQLALEQTNSKITVLQKEAKALQTKIIQQKENIQSLEKVQNLISEAERTNIELIAAGKQKLGTEAFGDEDWWNRAENDLQKRAPWLDKELNHLRARLFLRAMRLHETFIRVVRSKIAKNLRLWADMTRGNAPLIKNEFFLYLWQTFFLAVPVVSTTFASFGRMFSDLGRESLGWLLTDEAGQATPQAAVGALWRAKRTIVVGDPLQIEPVVGLDETVIEQIRNFYDLEVQWSLKTASVQTLADRANSFGAYIFNDDSKIWVGCPLRVHRRCTNPMFDISNKIAYGGKMVYAAAPPKNNPVLGKSRWIHSGGKCKHGHWVDELWLEVKKLLAEATRKDDDLPKLFIISPFRDVARELKKLAVKERSDWLPFSQTRQKEVKSWAAKSIGTVHTFQGKEKELVIFVLGADENSKGSAYWAASKPNLLNVAVTRAKYGLYIIGNYNVWANLRNFRTAYQELSGDKK
jgi:hypothetical protein